LLIAASFVVAAGVGAYYFLVYARRPGQIELTAVQLRVGEKSSEHSLRAGDQILVDGAPRPLSGSPPRVDGLAPGDHVVTLRREGYRDWQSTVRIEPNQIVMIRPQLVLLPTAAIELRSQPAGARAYLNGRLLEGKTPMRISQLLPTEHMIEVKLGDSYRPWRKPVRARPKDTLKVSATFVPKRVEVTVESDPERAEIYLVRGGREELVGKAPQKLVLDPTLEFALIARRDRHRPWRRALVFGTALTLGVRAKLEPLSKTELAEQQRLAKQRAKAEAQARRQADAQRKANAARAAADARAARSKKSKEQPTVAAKAKKSSSSKALAAQSKPGTKPATAAKGERPSARDTQAEKPKAGDAAAKMGTLMVNTVPWTQILIDGRDTGLTTPQRQIALAAGKHKVTLRNPKFNIDQTFVVAVMAGKPTKLIKRFGP
jgi:hypothetical protein